jgi:hypothetical protein
MGRQPPAARGNCEAPHLGQENPLFRFGVNLEGVGEDGRTHLHTAAMFSNAEKVRRVTANRATCTGVPVNLSEFSLLLKSTRQVSGFTLEPILHVWHICCKAFEKPSKLPHSGVGADTCLLGILHLST